LEEISAQLGKLFYINENDFRIEYPIELLIEKEEINKDFSVQKDSNIGQFDLDKLVFPLTIRKWQKGDYFMPLGMSNLKKLSDFFIDQKLSISEKENIWILESENKIAWIIGLRPDERFKVSSNTKRILKIRII